MEKMKELYEKVAKDSALQGKFVRIMDEAGKAGEAETGEKLIAFAKEAGYELSLDEIKAFFQEFPDKGELPDADLDMVAGGKSMSGIFNIFVSAASAGIACALGSFQRAVADAIATSKQSCSEAFE